MRYSNALKPLTANRISQLSLNCSLRCNFAERSGDLKCQIKCLFRIEMLSKKWETREFKHVDKI